MYVSGFNLKKETITVSYLGAFHQDLALHEMQRN